MNLNEGPVGSGAGEDGGFGGSNQGHSAQFYSNYGRRSHYWEDAAIVLGGE